MNSKNFDLLFELVEEVIENVLELKDITQEIRFTEEEVESGNLSITVPKVEAGEVTFDREFTRVLAEDFVEGTRNRDRVDFSFTDVTMQAGSLDFSAQVVDENWNSFEGVIELFSYRDDRTSRIVSAFVVGDCDDETKTQGEKYLCSCVDAASGVRSPEAAVLH